MKNLKTLMLALTLVTVSVTQTGCSYFGSDAVADETTNVSPIDVEKTETTINGKTVTKVKVSQIVEGTTLTVTGNDEAKARTLLAALVADRRDDLRKAARKKAEADRLAKVAANKAAADKAEADREARRADAISSGVKDGTDSLREAVDKLANQVSSVDALRVSVDKLAEQVKDLQKQLGDLPPAPAKLPVDAAPAPKE